MDRSEAEFAARQHHMTAAVGEPPLAGPRKDLGGLLRVENNARHARSALIGDSYQTDETIADRELPPVLGGLRLAVQESPPESSRNLGLQNLHDGSADGFD